jgi:hypothetical protein
MHWDHGAPLNQCIQSANAFPLNSIIVGNTGRRRQDTLLPQMFTAIPGPELIYRLQNSILLHNDLPFAMGISQTDSLGLNCSYHPVQNSWV